MLRQTTSHRAASLIVLDFLIPHNVTRSRRLARVALARASTLGYSPSFPKNATTSAQAAASSLQLAPLAHLSQGSHVSGAQPPSTLPNSQIEALGEAVSTLRSAFARRDITQVSQVWGLLKSRNLLAFLGPPQLGMFSRAVSDYLPAIPRGSLELTSDNARRPLSNEEIKTLTEIALVCATGGAGDTHGLKGLMLLSIKTGRPRDAATLYEQYVTRLREKGLLVDAPDQSVEELEEHEETDEATGIVSGHVRDEILLVAVVARMQFDSFQDIFPMYSQASTRVAPATLEALLPLFDDGEAMKIKECLRRLELAALLSRPEVLLRHITKLTTSSSSASLDKLYTGIVAGLHGSDPWVATQAADVSATRIVHLPDFFWRTFLSSFLTCRRPELAERLWDDMTQANVRPEVATWNALLDGYAKIRSVDAALSTWDFMISRSVQPDALSYRAIIYGLFQANRPDDALIRFRDFEQKLSKPGHRFDDAAIVTVYNTVIHHLLFASRDDKAIKVLRKMESSGPTPDIVTYNTYLRYYARKGDLKGVGRILQKLEPRGIQADIYTFSTLLSVMLDVKPNADRMMINFMKKQGVEPDTTTFTSIIDHQLREATPHNFKVAMSLLSKMEQNEYKNAEPNAITYTAVLTAINKGNWLDRPVVEETNRRIWDTMCARGIQANHSAYNILLKTSLNSMGPEGLENALAYYRDMMTQRVHIGNDTWYILLRGLLDRKDMGMANAVVEDLRQSKGGSLDGIPGSLRTLVDRIVTQPSEDA